jgi:hypothetical protein
MVRSQKINNLSFDLYENAHKGVGRAYKAYGRYEKPHRLGTTKLVNDIQRVWNQLSSGFFRLCHRFTLHDFMLRRLSGERVSM